jgi:hypothetical protein
MNVHDAIESNCPSGKAGARKHSRHRPGKDKRLPLFEQSVIVGRHDPQPLDSWVQAQEVAVERGWRDCILQKAPAPLANERQPHDPSACRERRSSGSVLDQGLTGTGRDPLASRAKSGRLAGAPLETPAPAKTN